MKCRYKFDVVGRIRLLHVLPIIFRDFLFEYKTSDNTLLKQIWVTTTVLEQANWPAVTINATGPVKADIKIPTPRLDQIAEIMRFLEGMLSFFGLESINIEYPEVEWIPENDEERKVTRVRSFKGQKYDLPINQIPETKLNILAQSLYAYEDAWHIEPQLNFVRRGLISIRNEQFIDAIYNFYFFLESRYGNGHTKNEKIENEFRKNNDLKDAIIKSRDEYNLLLHQKKRQIYLRFDKHYKNKTPDEIIHTLVSLRGFLHHHNIKRKDIWHPADKWMFSGDAFFLQDVVHRLSFAEVIKYMFSEKNEKLFANELRRHEGR